MNAPSPLMAAIGRDFEVSTRRVPARASGGDFVSTLGEAEQWAKGVIGTLLETMEDAKAGRLPPAPDGTTVSFASMWRHGRQLRRWVSERIIDIETATASVVRNERPANIGVVHAAEARAVRALRRLIEVIDECNAFVRDMQVRIDSAKLADANQEALALLAR